ncbi:hypothetical protein A3A46_00985 [Candidatus Roizmanbacteria bacterium RIFCSPLOWO2_01_FULL_37_13]|nr:MAG: hypothetical protein A3A46_00985 [Candidatus Roizmanbacteria bacterium RIFCSPLOWO2_01_FULL_37_13]
MHKKPKKFWQIQVQFYTWLRQVPPGTWKTGAAPLIPLVVGAVILVSAVAAPFFYNQRNRVTRPRAQSCQAVAPPPLGTMFPIYDFPAGQRDIKWNIAPGAAFYALRIDDKADDWPPARAGVTNTCEDVATAQAAGTNLNDVCINNLTTNSYSYNFLADHVYDWWIHAINSCGQLSNSTRVTNIRALAPPPTTGGPILTITPPDLSITPTPTATISPTPSETPTTSPPQDTPTIPPDQRCSLGNETYQVGESYCDEQQNIVKTCSGNDAWQDVPDACAGRACSNDPANHAYSCVTNCVALVDNPGKKLKIAFLPENYGNFSEFKITAMSAIDQLKKTNLTPLIDKMNFYVVSDLNQSYHLDPNKPYEGVLFQKIHETGASVCGADFSIVIDNPSVCGINPAGVAMFGLSSYTCGSSDNIVPHQLSHSIAWLDDEYGDAGSPRSPLLLPAIAPNCSDSPICSKWSGMAGAGCFQGCGYGNGKGFINWYRSSQTSIMRELGNYTFNPPSLKAWEDFLKNYQ